MLIQNKKLHTDIVDFYMKKAIEYIILKIKYI
jgi:hypothetical protein